MVVDDPADLSTTAASAAIGWDPESRELHLHNGRLSHVIRVLENGTLGTVHLGAPLASDRSYRHLRPRPFHGFANRIGAPIALEYPTAGIGDFRVPALVAVGGDGSGVVDLRYVEHRLLAGKPVADDGLPRTYVEADDEAATVEVVLADPLVGVEVTLAYSIFRDVAAIARNVRIRNTSTIPVRLETAMSASVDLPDSDWQLVQTSGAWARERHVFSTKLRPGRQGVSSVHGATGHQQNPFLALVRDATTEVAGEAYGFSLVYSGNFLAEVEVDSMFTTRVRLGIEPDTFAWELGPGATFAAPEAVVVWSGGGLGAMSDAFHRLYRERLARGRWRDRPRPVLLNNWEATYFDFDEPKLLEIATTARDLGVELFVLDDGWFGRRDDDTTSLGDWFVDRRKLPNGLDGLARTIAGLGIGFGLWIEPEMVSERSELFRAHPDWAIGIPNRPRTEARQQLVLDLSRPEVVDHLFGVLSDVLGSGPISYVKWDMNRNITEPWTPSLPPERQGEFFHRYILGVYELYRRLTARFPDILFESCAGGGGRFDPGLLAFAPQAWTSDQTDAVERIRIQWGTSLAYPQSAMGAHVSAVPNHQVGRVTPLSTRAAVAFFGAFGYELDPTRMSDDERAEVRDQIAFYKRHRELFQFGRFVRLVSPFVGERDETSWMVVSDDRRRAIVAEYRILNRPHPGPSLRRLAGLDPALAYRVSVWPTAGDPAETLNAPTRGGDELMAVGLVLDIGREEARSRGDFWSRLFVLEAE